MDLSVISVVVSLFCIVISQYLGRFCDNDDHEYRRLVIARAHQLLLEIGNVHGVNDADAVQDQRLIGALNAWNAVLGSYLSFANSKSLYYQHFIS